MLRGRFCLAVPLHAQAPGRAAAPGGGFRRPTRRYAIALGCEVRHANRLVYADDLDLASAASYEPIGVSCRICDRRDCHQRSVPPLEAALEIDHARREVLPYRLAETRRPARPGAEAGSERRD